jgi:uncharacterized protein DUF7008
VRETDPTPLLCWAGWDHAQQSSALSLVIEEREKDGWADERLVPLVAGLAELQPWVEQWHSGVDPSLWGEPGRVLPGAAHGAGRAGRQDAGGAGGVAPRASGGAVGLGSTA